MLTRNGIILHYVCCFCFYFLSGTQILTGWMAGISGVLGTIALASALLGYSPCAELLSSVELKAKPQAWILSHMLR